MGQYEIVKTLDRYGRIVIPKKWRDEHAKSGKVTIRIDENKVIITPYTSPELTEFFDKIEVDVKSDLSDWKAVRRELFEAH